MIDDQNRSALPWIRRKDKLNFQNALPSECLCRQQDRKPVMDGLSELIVPTLILATVAAISLWVAGAIYFDVSGGGRWGWLLVGAWAGGVLLLFAAWQPLWQ